MPRPRRQAGLALLSGEERGGVPSTAPPRQAAQPAQQPQPVAAAPAAAANTMVIERPLRSGQQIYARDTDLVLLAG